MIKAPRVSLHLILNQWRKQKFLKNEESSWEYLESSEEEEGGRKEPAKKPKSSTLQLEVDGIFQHGLRLERLYTNPEDAELGLKVRVEETGDVIVLWIVAALKDEDGGNAVYIVRYIIFFFWFRVSVLLSLFI